MKKHIVATLLFTVAACANAYERVTHQRLSAEAAKNSVLGKPTFLAQLGLTPKDISDFGYNRFPTSEGVATSILEVIKFGADWEDGRGEKTQATRHFFNPITLEALSSGPYYLTYPPFFVPKFSGIRSPDWALEDVPYDPGNLGLPQVFSYKFARRYFFDAVRLPEKADRDANWGLTFQTLGHVIHHLQDMAQPQHTRNDFHCDEKFCEKTGLLGGEEPSFEKFTKDNATDSQLAGYDAVYTKDDTSVFRTPRTFWLGNYGKGIAEFSNSNFFTAGTNVDATGVTSPQLVSAVGKKINRS